MGCSRVCLLVAFSILYLANYFQIGPDLRLDFSGANWYWKVLARGAKGVPVESWYQVFSVSHPFPAHLMRAIGLLLLNALGMFAIIAPIIWFCAMSSRSWQFSDGISAAAVAILLLMTFGLSRNLVLGGPEELMHRPFVWAYWLVGSLTAGRLFSMVAKRLPQLPNYVIAAGLLMLALIPAWFGSGLQRGKWLGGKLYTNVRVDRGLVQCADFIRTSAPSDAIAQDSTSDELLIFGGLCERRSFAARTKFWLRASKAFRESKYPEQLQRLEEFRAAKTIADLQRSVSDTGIRYYVLHPGDSISWPAFPSR